MLSCALGAIGPLADAVAGAPVLLRARPLRDGAHAHTFGLTYRSSRLALSRERVQRANAAACEAIARATPGVRWTLGYPVLRRWSDEDMRDDEAATAPQGQPPG